MTPPMIENSDRGITINKSLAWTMLVGILTGGVWLGINLTETKEGIGTLQVRQAEDRQSIRQNRSAINGLRNSNARIDERLRGIEQSLERQEGAMGQILRYIESGQQQ